MFEQQSGRFANLARGVQDFLMRERVRRGACGLIRDAGYRGCSHSELPGDDDFRHGAHAHGVSAQTAKSPDLRGSLIARAANGEIHPFMGTKSGFPGRSMQQAGEMLVIRLREIHKTREAGYCRAAQRIYPHEIDVVSEHHEMSGAVFAVQSAGGVGEDDVSNSERCERADGESDPLQIMSLIEMYPAAEDEHRDVTGPGCNEFPGMAGHAGAGKAGDLGVRDTRIDAQMIEHMIEAAAQDYSKGWTKRSYLAYFVGGMFRTAGCGAAYGDS